MAPKLGIALDETLAVGDGANDLAMIKAPGWESPIAPNPSSPPRPQARVDHGDLTALLYAQGIARREFVED